MNRRSASGWRISDGISNVCSSELAGRDHFGMVNRRDDRAREDQADEEGVERDREAHQRRKEAQDREGFGGVAADRARHRPSIAASAPPRQPRITTKHSTCAPEQAGAKLLPARHWAGRERKRTR